MIKNILIYFFTLALLYGNGSIVSVNRDAGPEFYSYILKRYFQEWILSFTLCHVYRVILFSPLLSIK